MDQSGHRGSYDTRIPVDDSAALPRVVGDVLRHRRRSLGLTLREVGVRSQGKFKPSVIGGYERGERGLSLQRFCQIAELYHLLPDRLLAEAMTKLAPQGREELIIDLAALNRLVAPEARAVAEFVHRIRSERGDYLGEMTTLRAGDLKQLSLASGKSADVLLKELQPAVRPT